MNPTPGAVVSGVGTNHFTWGDPANFGTGPSALAFTGSSFQTSLDKVFSLGSLTYFNGSTAVGSDASSVDFRVTIQMLTPAGINPAVQAFTFPLSLVTTPNVGNLKADADYVYLPSFTSTVAPVFTDANGNGFTLQLVGMGKLIGGGFEKVDQFHVYEGATASAQLLARLVPDIDLSASLDDSHIVPNKATDLHLLSFFGGEGVRVPVIVTNEGTAPAKGTVTIKLFLFSDPAGGGGSLIPVGTPTNRAINLEAFAQKQFNVLITIPSKKLQEGTQYYVVAQVIPKGFREKDMDKGGVGENNFAISSDLYEFLGTPRSNPKVFTNGTYFRFMRHLLQGQDPPGIPHSEHFRPDQVAGFVAGFEGKINYPYKVAGQGNTTIGIGMEIPSVVSAGLLPELKQRVQAFAGSIGDSSWDGLTDQQFIQKLNARADKKDTRPIMSAEDVDALFTALVQSYETATQTILNQYGIFPNVYQYVALVDIQYNVKRGLRAFPSMLTSLQDWDPLRAAFHLVDSKRTTQFPGLTVRTEAEFQNILWGLGGIGELIP